MKALKTITLTAACLFSANSFAADVPQVYDRGLDADTRIYAVACPQGGMASVTIRFNNMDVVDPEPVSEDVVRARTGNKRPVLPTINEVCIYPISDRDQFCTPKMDIQKAALEACR